MCASVFSFISLVRVLRIFAFLLNMNTDVRIKALTAMVQQLAQTVANLRLPNQNVEQVPLNVSGK